MTATVIIICIALLIGAWLFIGLICLVIGIIRMALSRAREKKADMITRAIEEVLEKRDGERGFFR